MSDDGKRQKSRGKTYYDYLICLECESPCYIFEFKSEALIEAMCEVCANDDVDLFLPEEEFEMLADEQR